MNVLLDRWQFGVTIVYHFLFVPLTIGLALAGGGRCSPGLPDQGRDVGPADPVLRHAVPDQLRDGRRHRDRPGVPVRHELVELLGVRGQHLRRPAGHRGPARVLPGVHVHRAVDLRPEPAGPAGPPVHLPGEPGQYRVRVLHPGRQRLDAAPRGLPHRRARCGPGGAHRFLGGAAQLHAVGGVRPHRAGRVRDRRDVRPRRVGMAAPPRPQRRGVHPGRPAGRGRPLSAWSWSSSPATSRPG